MDRKSLIEVPSALKPGDRLEWIRHIKGSPTHVVIAIGIRTLPALIVVGVVAYKVLS